MESIKLVINSDHVKTKLAWKVSNLPLENVIIYYDPPGDKEELFVPYEIKSDGNVMEINSDTKFATISPGEHEIYMSRNLIDGANTVKSDNFIEQEKCSVTIQSAEKGFSEVNLPKVCQQEQLTRENPNLGEDVTKILYLSDNMSPLLDRINQDKGNLVLSPNEPPQTSSGDVGRTGRNSNDPNNRELVCFDFAWSRIKSRFHLASIMSHEYKHAQQIIDRTFTSTEAAPFLTLKQYLILKRWSEYEAFEFQANVLKQISDEKVVFKPCVNEILDSDLQLKKILDGRIDRVKEGLCLQYSKGPLKREYDEYKEKATLENLESDVKKLLNSDDWKEQEEIWSPFIKKRDNID